MDGSATSVRARVALGLLLFGYAAVDVLGGAGNSPVVPPMPAGASVPGWTARAASALGLEGAGRSELAVITMGILVVLVAAFVLLVREALAGRVRLGAALSAAAGALALSAAGPLLLSRDVYSYADYGRILWLHHASPYLHPPSSYPSDPFVRVTSPEWVHTRALYGPLFVLLSAGVTRAWSGSTEAVITAFKVLAAVEGMGAACLASVAARRWRPDRAPAAVAVVGLNPVLVLHAVGGGHTDVLSCVLMAGALVLSLGAWRGPAAAHDPADGVARGGRFLQRPLAGGAVGVTVLLTLTALVKVILAIPGLVWFVYLCRCVGPGHRVRTVAVHAAVALAVAVALFVPVYAGLHTFAPLATLSGVQGWASGARLVARGAQALANPAGQAVLAAFLFVYVWVLWRQLRSLWSTSLVDTWGAALLLFAMAAPYLTPWYAVWFLPFLALLADAGLTWIGVAVASVLALTGVPAEPDGDPGMWHAMLLAVHYLAAPIMLALFVASIRRLVRAPVGGWTPPDRRRRWRRQGAPADPARPARSR